MAWTDRACECRRVGGFRIIFRIDFKVPVVAILDIVRRTTTTYR
jgi:mRNA-degrading endonuclease RelE of RelBE toxin-antitoxin system